MNLKKMKNFAINKKNGIKNKNKKLMTLKMKSKKLTKKLMPALLRLIDDYTKLKTAPTIKKELDQTKK